MNIHEELWSAFGDISFEESTHTYTDSVGTKYSSATGWIKRFVEEKDWDEIAEKAAKKKGCSAAELREQWKKAGDYACALGTEVHLVMENIWQKKNYNFDKRLCEKYPDMEKDFEFRKKRCHEMFEKMKGVYVPVANEFIVYDRENGLCGTIDFLAYNKKTGAYSIIDWKTSKTFETENRWNKLKAPFSDIDECNTAEYSLQLSLYKYMLEKYTSIKISEMILFQIPGEDVHFSKVYKCLDLSERIKNFLEKK